MALQPRRIQLENVALRARDNCDAQAKLEVAILHLGQCERPAPNASFVEPRKENLITNCGLYFCFNRYYIMKIRFKSAFDQRNKIY
jgi:hypothetical protein